MTRARWVIVAMAALALVPADGWAQRGPPRGGQERQELERRIRARFAEIVRERLQLTDEQAEGLGSVLRAFEDDRRELRRREMALRRRVQAFSGAQGEDAQAARAIMEEMAALRLEEAQLFQREQTALLEVLTPVQLVRFHAAREELSQRVRRLRGMSGRRPGGDGSTPPWGW